MANTQYKNDSPYAKTDIYGNFLDVANLISIPMNPDDALFTVNATYQNRPDLLAYDLYGNAALWWVFALRNPNTIKDPIFDMRTGVTFYLPKKSTLTGLLG